MHALILEELSEGQALPVNIDILLLKYGRRAYRFNTLFIRLCFTFSFHNRFVYQFELVCSYLDAFLLVDLLTTSPGHAIELKRSFHCYKALVV